MPSVLELHIAGEPMQAFADRALYWPARRRLLIADLHLGKGNVFRWAGIPVPSGGTRDDLARLALLLHRCGARELWILGDFLHGPRHTDIENAWSALVAAHPQVRVSVIAGNHDRALTPGDHGVDLLPDDLCDGPFRFRHQPITLPAPGAAHVLCGHVHPVVRLRELPGRHPAFLMQAGQTVLPAFSQFTGGHRIDDRASHWLACTRGELLAKLPVQVG